MAVKIVDFITAAMSEAHPDLVTPHDLSKATERQAEQMAFIRRFRADYEANGQRASDMTTAQAEQKHLAAVPDRRTIVAWTSYPIPRR